MGNKRVYYSHEAEMQAKRSQMQATFLYLALGLGIGAVLALLFAPNTGKETREGLANTLEDRIDGSRDMIYRMEKELKELRERLEDRLG